MERMKNYEAPEIEVIEVAVEHGFAGSNLESIDKVFPEGEW